MTEPAALRHHYEELADRLSPIFRLLAVVDAAPSEVVRAAVRAPVQAMIELSVHEELTVDDGVLSTARALLARPDEDAIAAVRLWSAAVTAAAPSRKGMDVALRALPERLAALRSDAREAFIAALPDLGESIGALGADGVARLVADLGALDDEAARARYLELARAYGFLGAADVRAVGRIAMHGLGRSWAGDLARLPALAPPAQFDESRDLQRLLPRFAQLLDDAAARAPEALDHAAALMFALLEKSASSAYVVARDLPALLATQPPATAAAYLGGLATLIRGVGPRAVRFGLKDLPRLYAERGAERAGALVSLLVAVAERSGATAAQWLWERKTQAARALMDG